MQEPNPNPPGISGSIEQTLSRRLPNVNARIIGEFMEQLQDMRITRLTGLRVMMTAGGAEDLRHGLTDLGRDLLAFILDD
jgi:hypothetical protein